MAAEAGKTAMAMAMRCPSLKRHPERTKTTVEDLLYVLLSDGVDVGRGNDSEELNHHGAYELELERKRRGPMGERGGKG